MLLVTLRMIDAPEWTGIAMRSADGTMRSSTVEIPEGAEFVRYGLPLKCLRDKGLDMAQVSGPLILATEGPADFLLSDVRLGTDAQAVLPCR